MTQNIATDTTKKYFEDYIAEVNLIRELDNRNDALRDQTLIQVSVGLFAVLATFGHEVLKVNVTLSVISYISLALTIVLLVTGFLTTSKVFREIIGNMKANIDSGDKFYANDYTKTVWQDVNKIINIAIYILFLLSIAAIAVLTIIYIGGLNGK